MLRSSLGFHTMTVSRYFLMNETRQVISDFKKYSQKTGNIKIYPDKYDNVVIEFYPDYIGMKWLIRCNIWINVLKTFVDVIDVTLNPKILGGVHDYITAANYDDMDTAVTNFNLISNKISPLLGNFDDYRINRLDYCINLCVDELVTGCNANQVVELIRRGNIPPHYKEFMEYDNTAHRMKRKSNSFYLISHSTNINCYNKYIQLLQKSQEKNHSSIEQTTLDAAYGIIRFEVQNKYMKMYALSKKAEASGSCEYNKYKHLLTHIACIEEINKYYVKVVGKGDWYTLEHATQKIKTNCFNKQKEERLVDALQLVTQCRSLAKAKALFQGKELKTFKKTLSDLSSLNINPVTIPKAWGINHIPNLLYAYYNKVDQQKLAQLYPQDLLY